jgi:hypothetical protein
MVRSLGVDEDHRLRGDDGPVPDDIRYGFPREGHRADGVIAGCLLDDGVDIRDGFLGEGGKPQVGHPIGVAPLNIGEGAVLEELAPRGGERAEAGGEGSGDGFEAAGDEAAELQGLSVPGAIMSRTLLRRKLR